MIWYLLYEDRWKKRTNLNKDVHNWSICCNFWADWIRSVCYDMQLKFWMEDLLPPSPFSWSWLTAAELGQRERGISLFWAARGFLRGGIPIFLTVGLGGDREARQTHNGAMANPVNRDRNPETSGQEEFASSKRCPICPNFSLIAELSEHYFHLFFKSRLTNKNRQNRVLIAKRIKL